MLSDAFWLCLALVAYCYVGYPVLLAVAARIWPRPVSKGPLTPSVTVVISVYNEEDRIGARIRDLLASSYPPDLLRILIGSDGSNDATVARARAIDDPRVEVIAFADRRGKPAVLNDLIARADTDVVVFTDARQTFAPDAIARLLENFTDQDVGCVSGELMLRSKGGAVAAGVGLYWRYEKWLRNKESAIGSMLGATGAIYAIRRSLFPGIPPQVVLDDMYIPLRIVEAGWRAVFEPAARAFDDAAENARQEHARKSRTLYGNWQIIPLLARLFVPIASPVGFQLLSHKVLRLLVPFLLIAALAVNLTLLESTLYGWLAWAQGVFYMLAGVGHAVRGVRRGPLRLLAGPAYVPYVFCVLNFSVLTGLWRFLTHSQSAAWQKAKR